MIKIQNIEIKNKIQNKYRKVKYFYNNQFLSPEQLGIQYYKNKNYVAYWTENSFWWEILALLFWDIIFAKVESALSELTDNGILSYYRIDSKEFETVFQHTVIEENGMPNDLFSKRFWINRSELIKDRISYLNKNNLSNEVEYSYSANFRKKCRMIENWDKFSLKNILEIMKHVSKKIVIEICIRLLRDFNHNRSGLPDLTILGNDNVVFCEVKSENDKIRQNQIDWHKFLYNKVKLQTELLVINYSKLQIRNLISKYYTNYRNVHWSFGNSKSKYREKAINIISNQDSFHANEERNGLHYSANFSIKDINKIFLMLDYTGRWKTTKIKIDNEEISSSDLRYSLRCYRDKILEGAHSEWCIQSKSNLHEENPFACRGVIFPEFDFNSWRDYGYIDTERGIWIFDFQKIEKRIDEEIHNLRFCPFLNVEKIKNAINILPKRVNPKTDKYWVFVDHRCHRWFWHNNSWFDTIINIRRQFPGYSKIIGIEKISDSQAYSIINDLKYYT